MATNDFVWDVRVSADDDTIDAYLANGDVTPEKATASDLRNAQEWLALYQSDADDATVQAFANVIAYLDAKAAEMDRRAAVNDAKRAYAAEHGVPFSRVRIAR